MEDVKPRDKRVRGLNGYPNWKIEKLMITNSCKLPQTIRESKTKKTKYGNVLGFINEGLGKDLEATWHVKKGVTIVHGWQ